MLQQRFLLENISMWKNHWSATKKWQLFLRFPSSNNYGSKKMGVSPTGSLPFKTNHFPLNHDYGRQQTAPARNVQPCLSGRGQYGGWMLQHVIFCEYSHAMVQSTNYCNTLSRCHKQQETPRLHISYNSQEFEVVILIKSYESHCF